MVVIGTCFAWKSARESRRASQIAAYDKRMNVCNAVRDALAYCTATGSTPYTIAHSDDILDKQKKADAKEIYIRFINLIYSKLNQ